MASEAAVNWWDQIGMYLLRERWRYMGIAAFDAGAAHQKAKAALFKVLDAISDRQGGKGATKTEHYG